MQNIEVIKKLCSVENLSPSLEAFVMDRVILMNKNRGLRLIGTGKVLHCIASKVVVSNLREYIVSSAGS